MANSSLSQQIQARLNSLTKPAGSLGELETLALRYCRIRGELLPGLPRKLMFVFCADHGVVAEGVSLYPSEVTRQMVLNFKRGGAAINVLCRAFSITPVVVDAGVAGEPVEVDVDARIRAGTRNFAVEPAMSSDEALLCVRRGQELATQARCELAGIGEMGIGNTTAAAAVVSALTGRDPFETAGRGTGLDSGGVTRKIKVIRTALEKHRPDGPIETLSAVGGFEIGMMAGFLIGAHEVRLPVVVDGYIASAAALLAQRLHPGCLETAFFSHQSAEAGHRALLGDLGVTAPLDLGMRLGEGTGAALAMNLIETSLKLYLEMATFEQANVTGVTSS